jgi:hypothetical protein
MPNWCVNRLIISGKQELLKQFATDIKTEKNLFDFNTIVPYPEKYPDLIFNLRYWEQGAQFQGQFLIKGPTRKDYTGNKGG